MEIIGEAVGKDDQQRPCDKGSPNLGARNNAIAWCSLDQTNVMCEAHKSLRLSTEATVDHKMH